MSLVERVTAFEREAAMEPAGGYGGLDPSFYRYGDFVDYFNGVGAPGLAARGGIYALGCQCSEVGLLAAGAGRDGGAGHGDLVELPSAAPPLWDYSAFGPFVFRRAEYAHAVERFAAESAAAEPQGPVAGFPKLGLAGRSGPPPTTGQDGL